MERKDLETVAAEILEVEERYAAGEFGEGEEAEEAVFAAIEEIIAAHLKN